MKIKTDFITNSSSSSFVVVGSKIKESDYDLINKLDDDDFLYSGDLCYFYEEHIVGKVIAVLDSDEYEPAEISFVELQRISDEVRDILNKLGITEIDVKLIADIFAT